jgi:hypothetical protein
MEPITYEYQGTTVYTDSFYIPNMNPIVLILVKVFVLFYNLPGTERFSCIVDESYQPRK